MSVDVSLLREASPDLRAQQEELERAWAEPEGFLGWFRPVQHHIIGMRYIVTAFVFLILGGLEALLIRLQLSRPENGLLNPDLYNQVFTMHGTTMMFLFAVPVMEGMALYLIPLMVGTRNVAFPRLNAFGYWMYLFGGIFLYVGFLFNTGADAGWFAYTPLSGPSFTPGKRTDFWAQMITFTELAGLVGSVETLVTVFRLRAPGMSINRIPLFVWAMVVQSFMVLFAMPAVMLASTMLLMDRTVGTHFFNPAEGGDPLLWQHLFWFFGHPEVYIIFLPATGMVSAILPSFTRRQVFGYPALVLALVSTGFIGFGLWVHHMFATGLPQLAESYFTAASMMIVIPAGIQIFCWLATLWGAKLQFTTPMLFVLGFIALFVMGGLTGVMVASIPFDLQAHDTYFVVAHFHYVLIGGAVFPLLGALYFWFPKMTGRLMNETLGKVNFWTLFAGFNLTFFPMHILGLRGMPRRIYTYTPEMGWQNLNLLATGGAFLIAAGGAMFLYNVIHSRKHGASAGRNPWGAEGLEWSTESPAPNYNWVFLPVVRGRYALWAAKPDDPVVAGLATNRREVLATNTLDAQPEHRYILPGPTMWPFWTALAVTFGFIGSVFDARYVVPGAVLTFFGLTGWFWPRGSRE
jgi:cytochrome c oxidase subunit 1